MKYLLILDAVLLAACATMALVLGVVSLIYGFYTEVRYVAAQLPLLLAATGVFAATALACLVALHGVHRRKRWWWAGQLAVVAVAVPSAMTLVRIFS